MLDWFATNKEWFFSGAGVFVLGFIIKAIAQKTTASEPANNTATTNIHIENVNGGRGDSLANASQFKPSKQDTRILFVDDDTHFKVVKILKDAGWPHVKIIKDVKAIESPDILEANILFIDIQGVGKLLQFTDEGLGLALAIKEKYPKKKVIIYSAQTTGERFHRALQKADYSLPKNADPYQFIKLVEDFSEE